jgi:hypothetical protein
MRLHHCLLTNVQAEMLPCSTLQLQEFHSSISARFCQRAANKRVRANRKTLLVSHRCDICKQKANESFATKIFIIDVGSFS